MDNQSKLETVLQKDRFIIVCGLLFLCLLAWMYVFYLYRQMDIMDMSAAFFAMPMTPQWSALDFILIFLMWIVMMIAMMTPSVAPLILIFAMVNRKRKQQQNPFVPAGFLITGYFFAWAIFSFAATVLQWTMQQVAIMNPYMTITNKITGGIILIAAGIFQFSPLKTKCLNHCQTPLEFIHRHWKEGIKGALFMGLKNGWYCLGCCWILMLLLFISGIMNVLWIAVITAFVLIEKTLHNSKWISILAGVFLIIYGIIVLASK